MGSCWGEGALGFLLVGVLFSLGVLVLWGRGVFMFWRFGTRKGRKRNGDFEFVCGKWKGMEMCM